MAKKPVGLEQLLVEELQDLFDAEKQLVRALPKMAKAASDGELESALREHLEVTKGHVQRIERVFESMDMKARSRPCTGMKGIVAEGAGMLAEDHEEEVLDAAITGGARKVEHYEMAGYEAVISMAKQLGRSHAAQMLQQTLKEEVDADRKLAQISRRLVKEAASAPSGSNGKETNRPEPRARKSSGPSRSKPAARPAARPLMDHDEIRQWAEVRGRRPACVRGAGGRGNIGMIRLEFPGTSSHESLQAISWDDWFDKFDENGLSLLVQDTMAGGQTSNFNILVDRESVEKTARPKTRSAY